MKSEEEKISPEIYRDIFEVLCKLPFHSNDTPSKLMELARELESNGCIVDHEGDILLPDGDVYWPDRGCDTLGVNDDLFLM